MENKPLDPAQKEPFKEPSKEIRRQSSMLEDTLIQRAYDAMEVKDYPKAERLFREVLERLFDLGGSQKSVILTELGLLNFWLARYAEAKTYLEEALALSDENDRARIILGKVAIMEYDFKEARRHFVGVKEKKGEASLGLALIAIRMRDFPQAQKYLREASGSVSPRSPEYRILSAYVSLLGGDFRAAEAEASRVVKDVEHDPFLLLLIAEIFITVGDYGQCKSVCRKIEKMSPEHDHMFALLAQCAYSDEDYDGAKSLVDRSLSVNPVNMYAKTTELKLYTREGRYEDAELIGKEILQQSPEYSLGHTNLGDVYFLQGRYDLAKQEYLETHQPQSETKGAKLRQARILFTDGHLKQASDILENLLESKHGYYDDAMCDLVLIYDKLGDRENRERIREKMVLRKGFYKRIQKTLELLEK